MLGHKIVIQIAGGSVLLQVWTDNREAAIAEARKMVAAMGHAPLDVIEANRVENDGAAHRF